MFRAAPAAVHDVHANLSIANVDFDEFAFGPALDDFCQALSYLGEAN
ncbi:DUF6924 domain-containing protein [Streptomyces sp. NBC_01717]